MAQNDKDEHSIERFIAGGARIVGYLVYIYLVFVEIILTIGFFLLLLGANPDSEFTRWAYRSLDRAMGPFRGLFTPIDVGSTGTVSAVFDSSIIFAMLAYGVLLVIVGALLHRIGAWVRQLDVQRQLREQRDAYAGAASMPDAPLPDVVGNSTSDHPLPPPSDGASSSRVPR